MWKLVLILNSQPLFVNGHAYIFYPPMRGGTAPSQANGYCPQCLGSVQYPMDTCGNKKFLNEDAGPVTTLKAGQMVEFDIRLTAHHMGHFMFRLCNKPLNSATGGLQAEEACLNENILKRARPEDVHSDCSQNDERGDCQPMDEANPGYWYLPPKKSMGASLLNAPGVPYKFHYWIPRGFSCERCTLQWSWRTANSCTPHPDAYNCYFQNMTKKGWNAQDWCRGVCTYRGTCPATQGGSVNCGEQFKNCADVRVVDDGMPTPRSTPSPTPAPVIVPTPTPVPTAGSGPGTGECTDLTMKGSWATYSCSSLPSGYCAHTEVNFACCSCGGGLSGTVLRASQLCTDKAMTGIWVHYTCSDIQLLGKDYCAQEEVNSACCFCNGGDFQKDAVLSNTAGAVVSHALALVVLPNLIHGI